MNNDGTLPAEQPSLDLGPIAETAIREMELTGEFTAERFFLRRPLEAKLCVALLAGGIGVIRIGQMLSVSPNTVMAVRDRSGASIDIERERLARTLYRGAALTADAVLELTTEWVGNRHKRAAATTVDIRNLAVTMGIVTQNAQLLAGEATARMETVAITTPAHDDFNAYVRRLKSADATSLEVESRPAKKGPGTGTDLRSEGQQRQDVGGEQP